MPSVLSLLKKADEPVSPVVSKAVEFIKKREGFKPGIYRDATGTPTQGYGFTGNLLDSKQLTESAAASKLMEVVNKDHDKLHQMLKVPTTNNEQSALLSLMFNIGPNGLQKSTLLKDLNAGDRSGASQEFMKWTHSKGKLLQGLVNRRAAEQKLFNLPAPSPITALAKAIGLRLFPGEKPVVPPAVTPPDLRAEPTMDLAKNSAEEPLRPHQERVLGKLEQPDVPGLLLAHHMGTGKTRSAIEAIKDLNLPAIIIVPAALKKTWEAEIKRWAGGQPINFEILSQQEVARKGVPNDFGARRMIVVDEAHRAHEIDTQLLQQLRQADATKKLLLSGTPMINRPSDIVPLINYVAGKEVLPEDPRQFEKKYIGEEEVKPSFLQGLAGIKPGIRPALKHKPELRKVLQKYVDFQPGSREGFPSTTEREIKVPMTSGQTDIYNTMLQKAPFWVRWKVKSGLPPGKGELEAMKAFLTGPRQISNTSSPFVRNPAAAESAKVQAAFQSLKEQMQNNPRFKGVVYSNFLESGLDPYASLLKKERIPYGMFTGEMTDRERNDMVKQYNQGKIRALLLSSAGAEGLNLKGTRLMQILEPHFQEEKIKQVGARAVRYKSHEELPPEERNVTIERYLAQPRAGFINRLFGKPTVSGTDEYIYNLAKQKEQLNQQMLSLADPSKNPSFIHSLLHGED